MENFEICWTCDGEGHAGSGADAVPIICEACEGMGFVLDEGPSFEELALDRIMWARERTPSEDDILEGVAALEKAIAEMEAECGVQYTLDLN